MLVSVIVCSYNARGTLENTLDSILSQNIDRDFDYEVILVDNNSTDGTREMIESKYSQFSGKLRYVFEKRQGKSIAANTGVKESRGEIIVFTDADCTVGENWLNEMARTYKEYPADAVLGKITLMLPERKKLFPADFLQKRLAHVDYGNQIMEIPDKDLVGANMSYKREIFSEFSGFKQLFWPCDDTEFSRRISKNGKRKFYSPGAEAFHWIPDSRLVKEYFFKQSFEWGKVNILLELENISYPNAIRHTFVKWINNLIAYVFCAQKDRRFILLCNVFSYAGSLVQLLFSKHRPLKNRPCP